MPKRAVEITETYTPGRKFGQTRQVVVERIPATEITFDGDRDVVMTFDVAQRVEDLVDRALESNSLQAQRILYTPGRTAQPKVRASVGGPNVAPALRRADRRRSA